MRTLLIDASTTTLFVGAFENGVWLKLVTKESGALEGLFGLSAELFKDFPLAKFERIAMCEGPGRLMSLRVAAVAANEWSSGKKRAVYNSLNLAQLALQKDFAVELRAGAFAMMQDKLAIVSALPKDISLLTPDEYARSIEKLPMIADKIFRDASFFDPPLYAPNSYAMAKPGAISKETSENL